RVADGKPLLYTGGTDYAYEGTHYQVDGELAVTLRCWFLQNTWPQNKNIISNVLDIVRARVFRRGVRLPRWDGPDCPFTDARNVVAFRNGLYDLGSRQLTAHTPRWCSTYCLPYAHDPHAQCPRWMQFLAETMDEDSRLLLQEFAGYCLTGDT